MRYILAYVVFCGAGIILTCPFIVLANNLSIKKCILWICIGLMLIGGSIGLSYVLL